MLTRIRNALMVKKSEVRIPFSTMKWNIARILKEQGYIEGFEKMKMEQSRETSPSPQIVFDQILVHLKYGQERRSAISRISQVSTPGRRMYVKKHMLPIVLSHHGIAIISTSQGLMTNKEAKKLGLGGEVVCEIY